jgi:cytochrome c biogenesis protein CcmG, thiol:disulfide interchange protein DsbE
MSDSTSGPSDFVGPSPAGPASPPGAPTPASGAPQPSSGRTLLLGLGLTALVLVAAGAVAISGLGMDGTGGPADGGDAVLVDGDGAPGTIADRVPPDRQAPLPDIELGGFGDGAPVDTAAYRGKPLVLNFWGSWCPPCVEEMPDLQALADAGAGTVEVLGVNYDDQQDKAEALVASLGISFDLAVDEGGELFRAVEGFGMPTTLFVDAGGQIRYRHTGPLDAELLAVLVREHLDVEVAPPQ